MVRRCACTSTHWGTPAAASTAISSWLWVCGSTYAVLADRHRQHIPTAAVCWKLHLGFQLHLGASSGLADQLITCARWRWQAAVHHPPTGAQAKTAGEQQPPGGSIQSGSCQDRQLQYSASIHSCAGGNNFSAAADGSGACRTAAVAAGTQGVRRAGFQGLRSAPTTQAARGSEASHRPCSDIRRAVDSGLGSNAASRPLAVRCGRSGGACRGGCYLRPCNCTRSGGASTHHPCLA